MLLLVTFLRTNWRWVAFPLAAMLAVLLLTQTTEYGQALWARHTATKQADATDAARAARTAGEPSHRSSFDSTVWVQADRARELRHVANLKKQLDDSLTHLLPAVPTLPQRPARY